MSDINRTRLLPLYQDGDLIIRALPENRGAALLNALAGFDDEFIDLIEQGRNHQAPLPDREAL